MTDKPMIDSEATTAGAILQSMETDYCLSCSAEVRIAPNGARVRVERGGRKWMVHDETDCLRRQLAQAQERAKEAKAYDDQIQAANRRLAEANEDLTRRYFEMRRVVEEISQLADSDKPVRVLFNEAVALANRALASAPANPLAHFTEGQLYNELGRRGWKAATWAEEGGKRE